MDLLLWLDLEEIFLWAWVVKVQRPKVYLVHLGLTKGAGSLMPTAFGAITAASALAGLLTPAQEEEAQELARGEGIAYRSS